MSRQVSKIISLHRQIREDVGLPLRLGAGVASEPAGPVASGCKYYLQRGADEEDNDVFDAD